MSGSADSCHCACLKAVTAEESIQQLQQYNEVSKLVPLIPHRDVMETDHWSVELLQCNVTAAITVYDNTPSYFLP